jgi:hypothetical protein
MELPDGLTYYKQENRKYYDWAIQLEEQSKKILALLDEHENHPLQNSLNDAKTLLMNIERWKGGCLNSRTSYTVDNSSTSIWNALLSAYKSPDELNAILSIMQLRGFGSSVDEETNQRRAKLATSVLRFFWPDRWGVVDWRTIAVLGLLGKNDWKVDEALTEARRYEAEEVRQLYDLIDENMACSINRDYRQISTQFPEDLPRASDVDMALFGLSLMIW